MINRHRLRRLFYYATHPRDGLDRAVQAWPWILSPAFHAAWPAIDAINGYLVSPIQERWLFTRARRLPRDANILEVGSYHGRSTACLALASRNTARRIFVVDTFDGNEHDFPDRNFRHIFEANMAKIGVTQHIEICQGLSRTVAATWRAPIHMLFVDGSHAYEDVVADVEGFLPHVVPGGLVALHDVDPSWPGVLRAWDEVVASKLTDTGRCSTLAFGRKPRS